MRSLLQFFLCTWYRVADKPCVRMTDAYLRQLIIYAVARRGSTIWVCVWWGQSRNKILNFLIVHLS